MVDPLGVQLARIASEIGPALVPPGHQELLTSITATARKLFGAEACSIAKLSEDETELVFCAATGGADSKIVGSRLPASDGIAGWVTMTGQPLAVERVAEDPHWAAGFAASMGYLPQSMLAVPMETPRGVIGVIEVLDAMPETGHDIELLSLFATQAALAIESARAFNDLGRALFEAAASAVAGSGMSDDGLSAALDDVAAQAPTPSSDLAELAAMFAELSQLGQPQRATATRMLREFLAYARKSPEVS